MKKILLVGKFSKAVQNLNEGLSGTFNVQLCADSIELVEGMMKMVKPDMVLFCVMELENLNTKVFDFLHASYADIPVLLIGTKEGCSKYQKYFGNKQFVCLLRPVTKEILLDKCYELLNMQKQNVEIKELKMEQEEKVQKHILVVDDSALTLRSVKAMLSEKYQVSVATSGEQAMKSIKKKCPDLILLDYEMPECDGRMTLEMIRADKEIQDIPVIFLTGMADKEHIASVLRLNPAGYFLKPPEREKLLTAIEKILN